MGDPLAAFGLVLCLCGLIAVIPLMVAMMRNWTDRYVFGLILGIVSAFIIGCVLMVVGLMLGGGKPELVEGHCYQAVKHGHTVPIVVSTGKSTVVIPSYTETIDLVEVRCSD